MSNRGSRSLDAAPSVIAPTSLGEALQLLRHQSSMSVWAGGTWWLDQPASIRRGQQILSLHAIRELRRVVRTGHHVEIGAAVPAGRLLGAGKRLLPAIALDAIRRIGPPPVRNVATIGGAVALPDTILPITAALQLIDAAVELRRQGSSRWIPLAQFRGPDGHPRRDPGEIITRFRIPLRSWTNWMIHTYGVPYPFGERSLTLVGAASMDKTGIDEFRFSLVIDGRVQIRLKEAETDLVGRAVPLTERDRRAVIGSLEENDAYGRNLDDLGRWRASNGLRSFLLSVE